MVISKVPPNVIIFWSAIQLRQAEDENAGDIMPQKFSANRNRAATVYC
jgi:hypothetical protein